MSDTIDICRVNIRGEDGSEWYSLIACERKDAHKYAKAHRLLLGDTIMSVEGPVSWDRRKWMRHGHYMEPVS